MSRGLSWHERATGTTLVWSGQSLTLGYMGRTVTVSVAATGEPRAVVLDVDAFGARASVDDAANVASIASARGAWGSAPCLVWSVDRSTRFALVGIDRDGPTIDASQLRFWAPHRRRVPVPTDEAYDVSNEELLLSDGTVVAASTASTASHYPERPVARTNLTTRRAASYRPLSLPGGAFLVLKFLNGTQVPNTDTGLTRELDGQTVGLRSALSEDDTQRLDYAAVEPCAVFGAASVAAGAGRYWSDVTFVFSEHARVELADGRSIVVSSTGAVSVVGGQGAVAIGNGPNGPNAGAFRELNADATSVTLDGVRLNAELGPIARVLSARVCGVVSTGASSGRSVWSGRFAQPELGTDVVPGALLVDLGLVVPKVSRIAPRFALVAESAEVYAGDDFSVVATSTNGADLSMYAAVSVPPYKSRDGLVFVYTCTAPFTVRIAFGPTTESVASPIVIGAPVVLGGTLVVGAESTLTIRAASTASTVAAPTAQNASIGAVRRAAAAAALGTLEVDVTATATAVTLVFERGIRLEIEARARPSVSLAPVSQPQHASRPFVFRATVDPMVPGAAFVPLDADISVARDATGLFFVVTSRIATARLAFYAYGLTSPIETVVATTTTYAPTVDVGLTARATRGVPTPLALPVSLPRGTVVTSVVAKGCVVVSAPVLSSATLYLSVLCPTLGSSAASSLVLTLVGPDGAAFDALVPIETEAAVTVPVAPARPSADRAFTGTAAYEPVSGTLTVHTVAGAYAAGQSPALAWRLAPDAVVSVGDAAPPYTYTAIVTAGSTSSTVILDVGHATVSVHGAVIRISLSGTRAAVRAAAMSDGEHHLCVVVTPTETTAYLDGVRFAGLAVPASPRASLNAARGEAHTGPFFATSGSAARLVRARADAPGLLLALFERTRQAGAPLSYQPTGAGGAGGFSGRIALAPGDAVCVVGPTAGEAGEAGEAVVVYV